MTFFLNFLTILSVLASPAIGEEEGPQCKRFDQIYANGKEICENMWGDAFKYETDEKNAYTMWFFDSVNPNDQVSKSLGHIEDSHDVCHLQYFHKDAPGPEPDAFTECHPWKENACCSHETVMSGDKLNKAYGAEWHWDRCGPLSPECERFFVQEACFYECDPNAGYFRMWNSSTYDPKCDKYAEGYDAGYATKNDCDHNTWEMKRMPIKASLCNAWYDACRKDLFCSADDGDFFSCAAIYKTVDEDKLRIEEALNASLKDTARWKSEAEEKEDETGIPDWAIIVIVLSVVVAVLAVCGVAFLIRREKSGKPLFGRLIDEAKPNSPNIMGITQA